jgi:ribose-phosphate pyrophosphokinase
MNIIGDVSNRTCIIIDDIVDTANTLYEAASALKKHGAKKVVAYATHPILSGSAINTIDSSELDEIVITDTITLRENAKNNKKIRQLSVAEILAETIKRISHEDSVSSLFID